MIDTSQEEHLRRTLLTADPYEARAIVRELKVVTLDRTSDEEELKAKMDTVAEGLKILAEDNVDCLPQYVVGHFNTDELDVEMLNEAVIRFSEEAASFLEQWGQLMDEWQVCVETEDLKLGRECDDFASEKEAAV